MDFSFSARELQVIYAVIKHHRDVVNETLDEMSPLDCDREMFIEQEKHCNSILRKLKNVLVENGLESCVENL